MYTHDHAQYTSIFVRVHCWFLLGRLASRASYRSVEDARFPRCDEWNMSGGGWSHFKGPGDNRCCSLLDSTWLSDVISIVSMIGLLGVINMVLNLWYSSRLLWNSLDTVATVDPQGLSYPIISRHVHSGVWQPYTVTSTLSEPVAGPRSTRVPMPDTLSPQADEQVRFDTHGDLGEVSGRAETREIRLTSCQSKEMILIAVFT